MSDVKRAADELTYAIEQYTVAFRGCENEPAFYERSREELTVALVDFAKAIRRGEP